MTERWLTTTPLGTPVEPEVKIPYKGSVSAACLRMDARRLLFRASSGRDFKSSRNSISPEKEIPTARSRLSLSAIIRSALRVSRIRFRRSAGWFASRQT